MSNLIVVSNREPYEHNSSTAALSVSILMEG